MGMAFPSQSQALPTHKERRLYKIYMPGGWEPLKLSENSAYYNISNDLRNTASLTFYECFFH